MQSFLWLVTLNLVQACHGSINELNLVIDTAETRSGKPAAYIGQAFSVTVTLTLESSLWGQLIVDLQVPGSVDNDLECNDGGTFLNGSYYQQGCSNGRSFLSYTNASKSGLTYTVGTGIEDQDYDTEVSDYQDAAGQLHYSVDFGTVETTTSDTVVTVITYLELEDTAYDADSFYFKANALFLFNDTIVVDNKTTSNYLYKTGPQLAVAVSRTSDEYVQSGDTLTYTATVQHHPHSTEDATINAVS